MCSHLAGYFILIVNSFFSINKNAGILAKVREGAESMQQKIQSKSDVTPVKGDKKNNDY